MEKLILALMFRVRFHLFKSYHVLQIRIMLLKHNFD